MPAFIWPITTDAKIRVINGFLNEGGKGEGGPGEGSYEYAAASDPCPDPCLCLPNTIVGKGSRHLALDIVHSSGGSTSDAILASAGGTVTIVSEASSGGCGLSILISHEVSKWEYTGLRPAETKYCHLNSASVSSGDVVYQGDPIGYMGGSGAGGRVHLHFVLTVDKNKVDPCRYLPQNPANGVENVVSGRTSNATLPCSTCVNAYGRTVALSGICAGCVSVVQAGRIIRDGAEDIPEGGPAPLIELTSRGGNPAIKVDHLVSRTIYRTSTEQSLTCLPKDDELNIVWVVVYGGYTGAVSKMVSLSYDHIPTPQEVCDIFFNEFSGTPDFGITAEVYLNRVTVGPRWTSGIKNGLEVIQPLPAGTVDFSQPSSPFNTRNYEGYACVSCSSADCPPASCGTVLQYEFYVPAAFAYARELDAASVSCSATVVEELLWGDFVTGCADSITRDEPLFPDFDDVRLQAPLLTIFATEAGSSGCHASLDRFNVIRRVANVYFGIAVFEDPFVQVFSDRDILNLGYPDLSNGQCQSFDIAIRAFWVPLSWGLTDIESLDMLLFEVGQHA